MATTHALTESQIQQYRTESNVVLKSLFAQQRMPHLPGSPARFERLGGPPSDSIQCQTRTQE
ncbi:MAG: hypothetical protein CMJ49_09525 [Planctomycetaceae bacterium]|nr:hypothetical protein [Planctomycetaceae bacterium]